MYADQPKEKKKSDGACIGNRYAERFAPHLRDVLPAIFAQLGTYNLPALPPLLRVCRAWAAAGIALLWRRVSIDALLRIDDAARRQLYADAIQELSFHNAFWRESLGRPARLDGLVGLHFPRLRRVDTLSRDHLLAAGAIAPFLQPRLEALKCDARHLADAAVQQRLLAAAQGRQLRQLHLSQFRCGGGGVAAVRKRAGANSAAAAAEAAPDAIVGSYTDTPIFVPDTPRSSPDTPCHVSPCTDTSERLQINLWFMPYPPFRVVISE
jgi:hypothetical protein